MCFATLQQSKINQRDQSNITYSQQNALEMSSSLLLSSFYDLECQIFFPLFLRKGKTVNTDFVMVISESKRVPLRPIISIS